MDTGTLLLLALVLACPLAMLWMMRGRGHKAAGTEPDEHGDAADGTVPAGGRATRLEQHEPPYTKSDGMVAPKFGAAGSGGAEYERTPEMHDR